MTCFLGRGVFWPPFVRKLATPSENRILHYEGVDHCSTKGGKKTPWIASSWFFPSTLPQQPATVTEKAAIWLSRTPVFVGWVASPRRKIMTGRARRRRRCNASGEHAPSAKRGCSTLSWWRRHFGRRARELVAPCFCVSYPLQWMGVMGKRQGGKVQVRLHRRTCPHSTSRSPLSASCTSIESELHTGFK